MKTELNEGTNACGATKINNEEKIALANTAIDATSAYLIRELKDAVKRLFAKKNNPKI